ncbi:MAG: hypothetical protein ACKV2U_22220 [Bryobacteraceae bacterium]
MTLRPFIFALAAALSTGAQEQPNLFNAAPPEFEKALRERVSGFYQAYVDGKFRSAEQYVCEDTRDLHYNQEKSKIRGFEIIKFSWDDGFKKASAVTTVQTTIQMRGQNIPAAAPMATSWRLEEGKWCYFVDPTLGRQTPMGRMKPGPGNAKGMNIDDMINNPNIILNQVKVSKERFLLRSWEKSADSVVITNGMPGSISIAFQTETVPGLTQKIEKMEMGPGETSRIELVYDPKDETAKPTLRASLKIDPFGRTIIIPVVFDIPEEVKKQLPKP